jgi:hypothetical protein
MELDEQLRARLRALAERETGLDELARARLRARLLEKAHRHQQRGRGPLLWLAVPAFAALAGWLWFEAARPERTVPAIASRGELRKHESEPAATRGEVVEPPECARAAGGAEPGDFAIGLAGEPRLELARARLVKGRASVLEIDALSRCELGLSLKQGDVAVHARALRGGTLWIDSPLGRVQVRGTVFSVALEAKHLRIRVAEGVVVLRRGEQELAQVETNGVLRVDADGALSRSSLGVRERAQLLARLSLAVAREQDEAVAEELPAADAGASTPQGARLWREGAIPAFEPEGPSLPSSIQPDGRPMKKPRLIE